MYAVRSFHARIAVAIDRRRRRARPLASRRAVWLAAGVCCSVTIIYFDLLYIGCVERGQRSHDGHCRTLVDGSGAAERQVVSHGRVFVMSAQAAVYPPQKPNYACESRRPSAMELHVTESRSDSMSGLHKKNDRGL